LTIGSDGVTMGLTQYSYDAFDRVICVAQRMNPTTYASLPVDACVLGPKGAQGDDRITRNSYDALIGVGGEVVFDDSGSEIGRAASLGAGGGGSVGRGGANVLTSSQPLC